MSVALENRLEVLRSHPRFTPGTVERFARFLVESPEEALFRTSPLHFAADMGMPENEAIDLFLRATHAGILEFTWGVLCPGCGSFLTTPAALRSLQRERDCQMCRVSIKTGDDNMEVAFSVAPSVRRIRFHQPDTLDLRKDLLALMFSQSRSIPEDVRKTVSESVLDSVALPPGGVHRFTAKVEAGQAYFLAVPLNHVWCELETVTKGGVSAVEAELMDGRLLPAHVQVRAGEISVTLHNRTSATARVALVKFWIPNMAMDCDMTTGMPTDKHLRRYFSGKRLVTHQTFRELFRAESIPSEGGLEFKSLTVLFTDLKGSTEMYERIGDLRAYGLVRDHFGVLRDIIAERGGSMVKTIGDAVMASFAEPAPALEAATAMTREVRRVARDGAQLQLKVGLHTGPCIAVELNERLDYFGQTVNVASRVQGVAGADEIAITEPVYTAPGSQDIIRAASLNATRERTLLKGVEGETTVYRLR
ncbi:adenylate/guanylate cyclase domain-containing protein [Hyalangium versicolor]|uniref:adenylate/guanylate cyclase domain-containing protein n=1 Tax=Hyalangium versicolor TaxID=2861190 RepID=UPI001CCDB921|nr:adenylate/guanylate cyclase domain-containing protein [Hyalangium versicolor]